MLNNQLGVVEEVTYGTPVVVSKFFELLPGESLDRQNVVVQSEGMRAGRRLRPGARRYLVHRQGGGSIPMEVGNKGFGIWLKHLLGSSTIAQQAATTAWLQTHTPGTLKGKSLTIQKGVEKSDDLAQAFTLHGCKVVSGEFRNSPQGILLATFEVDAEDVDDTTALATASYPANLALFHYKQGVVTVGGTNVATVGEWNARIANSFRTDRLYMGNDLKKEPLENEFRQISGQVTADFENLTHFYDRFELDSSAAVVLTYTGAVIEGAHNFEIIFTFHDVRFTGEVPKIAGPSYAVQNVPWEAFEPDSGPAVTITYKSTDVAI